MITREDDVDAHALHRRGGRSPRSPGTWAMTVRPSAPTCPAVGSPASGAGPEPTVRAVRRLLPGTVATPRICGRPRCSTSSSSWATTAPIPTFTRQLRTAGCARVRPCRPAADRPVAVIEHPPGEESPVRLAGAARPARAWGWGSKAFLLVGALAHSGRWRGVLAESTDQPHLIDALHRVAPRWVG